MQNSITGKNFFALLILIISSIGCSKKDTTPQSYLDGNYYIAPNGDDSNSGTFDKPFKSWGKILSLVNSGDLIYVRGGTYFAESNKQNGAYFKGKNGLPGNYIKFWAYPGEKPVLDCSTIKLLTNLSGVEFAGDYWHFKGLEVMNLPQPIDSVTQKGLFCVGFSANNCNNNIFEDINVHNNGCIGFYLGGNSTNNLILNCDSHHNYDPYTFNSAGVLYDGGNADGFHITLTNISAINTFSGCRSWSNSDDGFDTWGTEGTLIFEGCWSFWNGYLPGTSTPKGDGMGFKLGETTLPPDSTYHRVVENCCAFENRGHGFDRGDATVLMQLINNTAYANVGLGFSLQRCTVKYMVKNNISLLNDNKSTDNSVQAYINPESDQSNNSWTMPVASVNEFVSTSSQGADGDRGQNGSLPLLNFLRLTSNSIFIDKGVDVGLPFLGTAPDLGAFELK